MDYRFVVLSACSFPNPDKSKMMFDTIMKKLSVVIGKRVRDIHQDSNKKGLYKMYRKCNTST